MNSQLLLIKWKNGSFNSWYLSWNLFIRYSYFSVLKGCLSKMHSIDFHDKGIKPFLLHTEIYKKKKLISSYLFVNNKWGLLHSNNWCNSAVWSKEFCITGACRTHCQTKILRLQIWECQKWPQNNLEIAKWGYQQA